MTMQIHRLIHSKAVWLLGLFLVATPTFSQADTDWPLIFTEGEDQVQVFKFQPESFDGTTFTARAAVALQRPQDETAVFGAIWGDGTLAVDRSERMGELTNFKVTDVRFPSITDPAEQERIKKILSSGIVKHAKPIAIDWLIAALEEEKQTARSYENTPPKIIYTEKPSVLLFIDGDPIYERVEAEAFGETDPVYAQSMPQVERVVNTPFFLVRTKNGKHWLHGSGLWYSAASAMGPWSPDKKVPEYLQKLAEEVDGTEPAPKDDPIIPEVVVTTQQAVLLDLNGSPKLEPFENSSLMYATNTDNDLFMYIPTQEYYFLAAGRWYATKDLKEGPWRFVPSTDLPADFSKVPEGSAKDGILAHVAGTPAAREAVRDAAIPQTAQVDRRTATVTVTYDGAPSFRQISGTHVYAAENANTTVLRINGRYHVLDNAVWFEGDTPDGPWTVSTSVPREVNDIPPSDPTYRARYVYIYDTSPDVVFVGYTPGYLGSYVQGGVVIYGTGYTYDPWYRGYWYPRPYTWGFHMRYNPWYGWGFGATWGYNWFYPGWNYYGYYRPYSWGWWGPYGYCPPVATWYGHYYGDHYGTGSYYGHRPGLTTRSDASGRSVSSPVEARERTDLYRNHSVPGVTPSELVRETRTRTPTGTTVREADQSRASRAMKPIKGDLFTDREGNIYRSENGATQTLRDGRWTRLPTEERTRPASGTDRITDKPVSNDRMPQRQEPATTAPPSRTPSQARPSQPPTRIQQERQRGDQRVDDFRGYRQDRNLSRPPQRPQQPSRVVPPANRRTQPARTAPQAPRPSQPSMRSSPSAPSRGGAPTRSGGSRRAR